MLDDDRDMCPICKTDKYLSPNMTFLINPECYHKICESCVDRIFLLGPAPCPYPGCGKILRKNKFKTQVFEDLQVEREIDIRKKVSAVYNKTEEDFTTLDEYNRYLENIETVIFNLNNGIDVSATEAELAKYEQEHRIEILEKNMRESQKTSNQLKYQEALERLKQEKFRLQKQMEMEDIEYQKQQQQELLDKLSNALANLEEIIRQQQNAMSKRTLVRKKQLQQLTSQLDQQFTSQMEATSEEPEEVVPFTPFQGDRDMHLHYKLLPIPNYEEEEIDKLSLGTYYDPYVNKFAKNKEFLGGGWRLEGVFDRALSEAFMGLGCDVEKEKEKEKEKKEVSDEAIEV